MLSKYYVCSSSYDDQNNDWSLVQIQLVKKLAYLFYNDTWLKDKLGVDFWFWWGEHVKIMYSKTPLECLNSFQHKKNNI